MSRAPLNPPPIPDTPMPPLTQHPQPPWTPDRWRRRPAAQLPDYDDIPTLAEVEERLAHSLPLVFAGEIRTLRQQLAEVAAGRAFLLQGGDCAESFADFNERTITDTFRVLLQMAVVLTFAAACPVAEGRANGRTVRQTAQRADRNPRGRWPSPAPGATWFNDLDFTLECAAARPAPTVARLCPSAATLNLLRALAQGGFANMHRVQQWNLDFLRTIPRAHAAGIWPIATQRDAGFLVRLPTGRRHRSPGAAGAVLHFAQGVVARVTNRP